MNCKYAPHKRKSPLPNGRGQACKREYLTVDSCPVRRFLFQPQNPIHILLCRANGNHLLPQRLVFFIFGPFFRQQGIILFGELRHLGNGLAAQGVKGFLGRFVLGDLLSMGGAELLLVPGLLVGGVDLPRFGVSGCAEALTWEPP